MQAYSPRDPLAEFFRGEISLRKLAVMTKWLPPRSPAHRAARGDDWDDAEWMAWDSNKELRQIVIGLANMFREKGTPPLDVEFLWNPRTPRDPGSTSDEEATEDAAIRADMAVLPGWAPGSDTQ